MQAVNSILVPVDFSASSKHALAYAIQLADTFGASLHVIHVLDDSFALGGYLEMYAGDHMETAALQAAAEPGLACAMSSPQRGGRGRCPSTNGDDRQGLCVQTKS
jgi:nucleotide-binding universal stress UspA family protein